MLNIEVMRYGFGIDSTLGRLYLSDQDREREFWCFTLEDERRSEKVKGETCIPPGSYEIKLRTDGGMHVRYSERFPESHRGMLWLQDVENFQWVYIHIGNTEEHTDGCILVGAAPVVLPDGEFEIARSTDAYLRLYEEIVAALDDERRVFVHVMESQR